ncbi:hypothetical protein [Streptomyces sp. KR80]|uniref:hypothetical protein n=1 Tax=Streptomyces sp. KR80 TaxID=3457426 RepID=UPI003FCFBEEA
MNDRVRVGAVYGPSEADQRQATPRAAALADQGHGSAQPTVLHLLRILRDHTRQPILRSLTA